jgi:protein TonB
MSGNILSEWNPCNLTPAGEAELAKASLGLSVIQRKLLSIIRNGTPLDRLGEVIKVDSEQLQRDMRRLTRLGLVSNGDTMETGTAALTVPAPTEYAVRKPPWVMMVGIALVAMLAGLAWVLLSGEPSSDKPPPPLVAAGKRVEAVMPGAQPGKPAAESLATSVAKRDEPAAPTLPPLPASNPPRISTAAPVVQNAQNARSDVKVPIVPRPAPTVPQQTAKLAVPSPSATGADAKTPPAVESKPASAPVEVLAAKEPAAQPAPAAKETPAAAVVTYREQPVYPRSALQKNIESGKVHARLVIDPAGKVTQVQIIDSNPARIFDRAASEALANWRFQPSQEIKTYDTEIAFSLRP